MTARLFIAAKAPRPHLAKTRLGDRLGHERAAALYGGFLQDLAARFLTFGHPVGWFVPEGAWTHILEVIGPAWASAPVVLQRGDDWSQRQRALFAGAASRGEDRTAVMASDSPHLECETVARAFELLDCADVVLGPVRDGGYYLLGMRGTHDVLAGVAMGTRWVSAAVQERCRQLGLEVRLLPATFDVDEMEDLESLRRLAAARSDLKATMAALALVAG